MSDPGLLGIVLRIAAFVDVSKSPKGRRTDGLISPEELDSFIADVSPDNPYDGKVNSVLNNLRLFEAGQGMEHYLNCRSSQIREVVKLSMKQIPTITADHIRRFVQMVRGVSGQPKNVGWNSFNQCPPFNDFWSCDYYPVVSNHFFMFFRRGGLMSLDAIYGQRHMLFGTNPI